MAADDVDTLYYRLCGATFVLIAFLIWYFNPLDDLLAIKRVAGYSFTTLKHWYIARNIAAYNFLCTYGIFKYYVRLLSYVAIQLEAVAMLMLDYSQNFKEDGKERKVVEQVFRLISYVVTSVVYYILAYVVVPYIDVDKLYKSFEHQEKEASDEQEGKQQEGRQRGGKRQEGKQQKEATDAPLGITRAFYQKYPHFHSSAQAPQQSQVREQAQEQYEEAEETTQNLPLVFPPTLRSPMSDIRGYRNNAKRFVS